MATLAIVGGSGLTALPNLRVIKREKIDTPFGEPSAALTFGELNGFPLIFLARHGDEHAIPPHQINYRANIWALDSVGVKSVIAAAAVGGISARMSPGSIVIPGQIIDYSYAREQTFFDTNLAAVTHIDFTNPYTEALRIGLLRAAQSLYQEVITEAVYGCTQGPRLETAAEIARMERDGCDIVGMTGMPEASLAREKGLDYACCAFVVNWAAGKTAGIISMTEIEQYVADGTHDVLRIMEAYIASC